SRKAYRPVEPRSPERCRSTPPAPVQVAHAPAETWPRRSDGRAWPCSAAQALMAEVERPSWSLQAGTRRHKGMRTELGVDCHTAAGAEPRRWFDRAASDSPAGSEQAGNCC